MQVPGGPRHFQCFNDIGVSVLFLHNGLCPLSLIGGIPIALMMNHDDNDDDDDDEDDDHQGAVMMFPPLAPICQRILSRKKRFLKLSSSEKHISQDTSQNQTFIISSLRWISTRMQMKEGIRKQKKKKTNMFASAGAFIRHDGAIERNSYSVVSLWGLVA